MVTFSRRSFVEKLGLGAGAALLAPIGQSLLREAHGQSAERKAASFWMVANGMHWRYVFPPPEFRENGEDAGVRMPVLNGPTTFTMPASFQPLSPYRDRMLLMDGLSNQSQVPSVDGGHGMMFMALTCQPPGDGAGDEMPGGASIDQYLAEVISADRPRKSILIGASSKPEAQRSALFSGGRNRPEPAIQDPLTLYQSLFGAAMATAATARKERVVFDSIRDDVQRMENAFGVEERAKLTSYLAAMEDFEKRQQALGGLSCSPGAAPPANHASNDAVTRVESLHAIATLGLVCGVSNVMGVDIGSGFSHDTMPELTRLLDGTNFLSRAEAGFSGIGHDPEDIQGPVLTLTHQWLSGLIAKTIEDMKKVTFGSGKNLYDNSLTMFSSDNGPEHHSDHRRWPLVIVGDAGGGIRTGGRFIRYPQKGEQGWRSLADLYSSIAVGFGLPERPAGEIQPNAFGQGGLEEIRGPLELLKP
jgi:hypothetical protein